MPFDPPIPDTGRFRYYITDIEFQPSITDPNCNISAKLFVDDEIVFSFPWLDHTQPFRWSRLIACDVSPLSKVTLKLCKNVNDKHRSFIFPSYEVADVNEENGEVNLEHPDLVWIATIKSLTSTMSDKLFPVELDRLGRIEGTYDSLRPDETVKFLFKTALQLASIVAEVLPKSTAKLSFLILMKTWKLLEQITELDETIQETIRGLIHIQDVVEVLRQASDSTLASAMLQLMEPIENILRLLEDVSIYVFNRLVTNTPVHLEDTFHVQEYLARIKRLQSGFHASCSTLATPLVDAPNIIHNNPPTWQGLPDNQTAVAMENPYEVLEILRPINLGGYNPDHACMDGTRQAVLNQILTWTQNRSNPETFMWISGQAGMGKTSIATSLCQRLDNIQALAGSFFCQHNDPSRNNPIALIDNLVHDIAIQCPSYAHAVASAILANRKLCKAHLDLRYEGLVQKPLEQLISLSTPTILVLVIDGIDECGDCNSRGKILNKLHGMSKLVPWLKIVFTARPLGEIQEYFRNNYLHKSIVHLHDFDASGDIRAYIEDRLGELALMERWPQDNINKLCAMAHGVFLWASVANEYIKNSITPATSRLGRILENRRSPVIEHFAALYTMALDKAIDSDDKETKDAYIRCIGAILATSEREALDISGLQRLLLAIGHIDERTAERVIRNLGPLLLTLDRQCVRFHHPSFKNYITNASLSGKFCIQLDQYEAEPAACCLRIMQRELRFNICNLTTSHIPNSEVPDLKIRIDSHIGSALRYACMHWIDHFIASPNQTLVAEIRRLFEGPQLIYWMEVLSILGCLDLAVTGLSTLASTPLSEFDDWSLIAFWVKDARRFILSFHESITASTPHLYVSALAFAPITSPIAQRMRLHFPNTIKIAKGGNLTWHPCIRSTTHPHAVLALSVSLNRFWVATGHVDGSVCIRDMRTGVPIYEPLIGHSTSVTCVSLSPIGNYVAAGSHDTAVRVWDLSGSIPVNHILSGHSGSVHAVAFSPSATLLVTSSSDKTIRVWDIRTMKHIGHPYVGHTSRISCLIFSPDGTKLASGSWDKTIRIWSVDLHSYQLNTCSMLVIGCSDSITCVAFSPDGLKLASGSVERAIRLWDVQDGGEIKPRILPPRQSNCVTSLAFSPNGKYIVASSLDGAIQLWDATTLAAFSQPFGHLDCVHGVAFSPDSTYVISGSADKTLKLWDISVCPKSMAIARLVGHSDSVYSIACSSDGTQIISGSNDKTVRLWDAQNCVPIGDPFIGHSAALDCVTFSPDGTRIASGSDDNTIKLWNTMSKNLIHSYQHNAAIRCITFSADGALIVFGAADSNIYLWEFPGQGLISAPFQGHSKLVLSVVFSPDGDVLASASEDCTVILWDLKSRSAMCEPLSGHTSWVRSVAFSPCGTQIVSASDDHTVRIWDVKMGATIYTLNGHSDVVTTVRYSPDGFLIASGSFDRTMKLWNVKTGQAVGEPLIGHSHRVWSLAFSPDGRHIISGSTDGTLRIWIPDTLHSTNESVDDLSGIFCWPVNPYELSPHLHRHGWVTHDQRSLILWLPIYYQHPAQFMRPHSRASAPQTFLDYSKFVHGTNWTRVASNPIGGAPE